MPAMTKAEQRAERAESRIARMKAEAQAFGRKASVYGGAWGGGLTAGYLFGRFPNAEALGENRNVRTGLLVGIGGTAVGMLGDNWLTDLAGGVGIGFGVPEGHAWAKRAGAAAR